MQKADKSPFIQWGFTRFNRWLIHRNFENIRLLPPNSNPVPEKTLYIINHSTWWDPLMIFYLNDTYIQSDGYGMMHEDGVNRYPFFKKIGAYSINTDHRKHLMESLHYSITLLKENKSVWVFPQGKETPLEKRPLQFFSGVSYIIQNCPDTKVVPISLYYSFEHTKKPNVYMQVGDPLKKDEYIDKNRKEMTRYIEEKATLQLDRLKELIIQENHAHFKDI
ncbi:lysophospholipid acyltransferase family protein [Halobacillus yeomjeoni]|uniref:Lysophospholipid acyltransferase family protein n=1 Tax=Halobacillus yeomjeoni TaxID=311194 RepID=A0A931MTI4_9BACI|nr:lysophospholipid acyltransferase family protein [Halobacillus yeomjeoni]MBH0228943.1 lysophospholipid acyltransferase family protein [Halobacillus yeomjeoni]MCA0983678.1 lysophospholipid acyltransferase family protein [Halobacillus yeomjeoni]